MNYSTIDLNKINFYQVKETTNIDIYMFAPYCNTIYIATIEYCQISIKLDTYIDRLEQNHTYVSMQICSSPRKLNSPQLFENIPKLNSPRKLNSPGKLNR